MTEIKYNETDMAPHSEVMIALGLTRARLNDQTHLYRKTLPRSSAPTQQGGGKTWVSKKFVDWYKKRLREAKKAEQERALEDAATAKLCRERLVRERLEREAETPSPAAPRNALVQLREKTQTAVVPNSNQSVCDRTGVKVLSHHALADHLGLTSPGAYGDDKGHLLRIIYRLCEETSDFGDFDTLPRYGDRLQASSGAVTHREHILLTERQATDVLLESRSPKRHAVRRDILDIYFGVKHVAEAQPTTQSAFEMQASFLALLQQGVDIVTAKATSVIDDRDRVIQKLTKTVEVQELLHLDPIRRQTEERSAVQLGAAMEVLSGGKIPHLTGESVNTLLMACGVLSRNRKPGYWEYTVTEEGEKLGRKVIMQSGKSYGPSTYNCVQWNNAVVPVLVNFYVQQGLTPDRLKAMTAEARHGGR